MIEVIKLTGIISENQFGQRLDKVLALIFSNYSRSLIKKWILSQCVLLNNKILDKPKYKVLGGESVIINAKIKENMGFEAQNIPLNIIYEDDDILIINKPRNLIVHPGAGNPDGTLLNALMYYYPFISSVPRAGIVHRLDKDTTGLMIVAKTIYAYIRLVKSLQLREITREYEAVAIGHIITGGKVDKPISRYSIKRKYMSLYQIDKPAVTHYRIIEHFRNHTHLRLRLETGRTHQIRIHMAYINHPLVGDRLYGGYKRLPKGASEALVIALRKFDRQALHANMLRLCHPLTGEKMEWHVPIPQDMIDLIKAMNTDCEKYKNKRTL